MKSSASIVENQEKKKKRLEIKNKSSKIKTLFRDMEVNTKIISLKKGWGSEGKEGRILRSFFF